MKKLICILICVFLLMPCLVSCDMAAYREAKQLIREQDYHAAYEIFEQLGDFRDSKEQLARFRYVPVRTVVNDSSSTEVREFFYDENNLPIRVVDTSEYGTTVQEYTYDRRGRVISYRYTDRDGGVSGKNYAYDKYGNYSRVAFVDELGIESSVYEYVYNADGHLLGKLTTSYDGDVSTVENTYDKAGNIIKSVSTDADGKRSVREYTYDENGNEICEVYTYPVNQQQVTERTYDDVGNLIKTVHTLKDVSRHYVTTYEYTYDARGNRILEVHTKNNGDTITVIERTYDENSKLLKREETIKRVASDTTKTCTYEYTYDEKGREISYECVYSSGYQIKEQYVYDADGNKIKHTEIHTGGENFEWQYTYDERGNKTKQVYTAPDGRQSFVDYRYDEGDNLIYEVNSSTWVDENGAFHSYTGASREREYKFVYIPYDLSEQVIEILEQLFAPDSW